MDIEALEIAAPAIIAWRLLTGTAEWPQWRPSVRAVESPQRYIGPGLRGRVQTAPALWLPFLITEWEPETQDPDPGVAHHDQGQSTGVLTSTRQDWPQPA